MCQASVYSRAEVHYLGIGIHITPELVTAIDQLMDGDGDSGAERWSNTKGFLCQWD